MKDFFKSAFDSYAQMVGELAAKPGRSVDHIKRFLKFRKAVTPLLVFVTALLLTPLLVTPLLVRPKVLESVAPLLSSL